MSYKPLDSAAIDEALTSLPGWTFGDDAIKKTYRFGSFKEAISFMVRIAFEAEALNHHPEWFNVYNRVEITLRTHDAGDKVSEQDIKLARAIDRVAWV